MTCSEQINLLPEGGYQRRPALHGSQIAAGPMSHIAEIASTVVGHGVMFEISPNALDWVHVGCVGRQLVDFHTLQQARVLLCVELIARLSFRGGG